MHESMSQTKPDVRPNDIEWTFTDGVPSLVAHVPDEGGAYSVTRLDAIAPDDEHEREFVRALLRIAQRRLDESEPTSAIGLPR